MNDELTTSPDPLTDRQHELLARLIRSAGPRKSPPEEHYDRVFAAASEALAHKRSRRRIRRRRYFALAATVCGAAIGGLLWYAPPTPDTPLTVTRVVGEAEWRANASAPWQAVTAENLQLDAVSELRTSAGGALSLAIGPVSLRLADETRLMLRSASKFYLERGKIYLDTGRDRKATVQVVTPDITVTNLGTQFEILYIHDDYRARIRSGRIRLAAYGDELNGAAGDELRIDASGRVRQARIAPDDPDWSWAERLAPLPDTSGQALAELLDWIAHETGREVVYASPSLKMQASQTSIHGSLGGLSPRETLHAVLATTDLTAETTDRGKILIRMAGETD
jgi:ferric-dicitrate binding protein FerR (iron transport regulator)